MTNKIQGENDKPITNKLSRNVIVLGFVSFFNDLASEMIYPVTPIFLTAFLGAPIWIIGLIEGIAEFTASLLQAFSGWFSDKLKKRKAFITIGYSLSTISKLLIGFAQGWQLVLLGRFGDRFGKGIRTSARDALIAESSTESNIGRSFGFHRALDTAGAIIGPLTAIWLIEYFGTNNLRPIFFIAFIPGLIGVLLLLAYIKESTNIKKNITPLQFKLSNLSPLFKTFLFVSAIFSIGNSSDVFLILRANDLGLSTTNTILAYVVFNFVYALFSTPAGALSDKFGSRKILSIGFFLFSLIYFLFGINNSATLVWFLFASYGLYKALTDGVSKAYISQITSSEAIATSFGVYQTITGICTLFSSVIAGFLWSKINPAAPFIFGSALAFISAAIFIVTQKGQNK